MTTKLATREDILNANDEITEIVEVPEWGVSVRVKALTGTERDRYEASGLIWGKGDKGEPTVTGMNPENMRARLVAKSLVDDTGLLLFSEKDVVALGGKNAAVLNRLFDVARRLSGLSTEDVEALVANLKGGPNATSGSD